ncbi:hypothetical protein FRB94_011765 [Tulasnella sp. JGI-2019a]|nr:hypothetical protein FRB94_011765 [Tulasnella sp. JGI-2019a]
MTISQDVSAPLVLVTLATGAQGGSVIKALSESDKPYRIRGLTRDTSKPASQALAKKGVEVVAVDVKLENKDAVQKTFQGATFAFLVTMSAVMSSKAVEIAEGKMYIDAAKAENVKLTIWSGLENMSIHSNGKYVNVDHFDAKAAVTEYAKEVGLLFVNVEPSVYMQNYLTFGPPRKQGDGTYVVANVAAPESVVPMIDMANDYGLFVRKAIESPGVSEVYAHGEVISYTEVVKQLSEITGKKVAYVQITTEQFEQGLTSSGFPEHSAKEVSEMFNSIAEFGCQYNLSVIEEAGVNAAFVPSYLDFGNKDIKSSLEGLVRPPRTWAEFVKASDWSAVLN